MKVEGKLKIVDPTVRGTSRSTGNTWQVKDVVIEIAEGDGYNSTLAARIRNEKAISDIQCCNIGDTIVADVRFKSVAREGRNGVMFRNTEVEIGEILRDLKIKKLEN